MQSTSNGFVIDPSPPSLEIIGTGENAIEHAQINYEEFNHTTYQINPSVSSLWQLTDNQSGHESSVVVRIGTYPGGSDVQNETQIFEDDSIRSSLYGEEGIPHYFTITAYNRAGLSTTTFSKPITIDSTPPTDGEVHCNVLFMVQIPTQSIYIYH